jgi:hypothetical protein
MISFIGRGIRFMIIAGIARHHGNYRIVIGLLSLLVFLFGGGFWLIH